MKQYLTKEVVSIFTGFIRLSDHQAAVRSYGIEATDEKGVYQILSKIQFKAGEEIGLDKPDKITLSLLECLEPDQEETEKTNITEGKSKTDNGGTGGQGGSNNEEDRKIEKVIQVISMMDPENKDDFTTSGLPRTEVIEDFVDFEVSAKLRDQVWEKYNATD